MDVLWSEDKVENRTQDELLRPNDDIQMMILQ